MNHPVFYLLVFIISHLTLSFHILLFSNLLFLQEDSTYYLFVKNKD